MINMIDKLKPWRLSGMLTATRTIGQVGMRKNGTMLDIWLRVNGKPVWFAVRAREVADFLVVEWPDGHGDEIILDAESNGNAETVIPEAEGNFEHPGWHHCPTPDEFVGPHEIGDRWRCACGQRWRVYEYGGDGLLLFEKDGRAPR